MEADRSPGSSCLTGIEQSLFLIDRRNGDPQEVTWLTNRVTRRKTPSPGFGSSAFCCSSLFFLLLHLIVDSSKCALSRAIMSPTHMSGSSSSSGFCEFTGRDPYDFMHHTECQTLALSTQLLKRLKSRKEKDEDMKGREGLVNEPPPPTPSAWV